MIPTKDTRFAVVQYGSSAMVISEFLHSGEKPVLFERIRGRVKYVRGSNVNSGMLQAESLLQNSGRSDAKEKIVLFTSGPASSGTSQLRNIGESLRDKNVKVVVVTVGNNIDQRVVSTAGTDSDVVNVFPSDDEDNKVKAITQVVLKGGMKCYSIQINCSVIKSGFH